jgi:hypothetical protein
MDWHPGITFAYLYQLIGTEGTHDPETGHYSGEINDTGVELQLRPGGPFVGFERVTPTLYANDEILLGMVSSDELVRDYERFPLVSVFAPYRLSPDALLYDPATYDFTNETALAESGATVLYFEGAAYIPYLVSQGILTEDQLDASYDGTPARFVAENGELVIAGFATAGPWKFENEIDEWGRPMDYVLLNDLGYHRYVSTLVTKPEKLSANAECLAEFIPMVQQGLVDWVENPEPVNTLLERLVVEEAKGWSATFDENQAGWDIMKSREMVGLEAGLVGGMDLARLEANTATVTPIYEAAGINIPDDLDLSQIFTNDYLDPSITMP